MLAFTAPLFLVAGLLSIPARGLLYRTSPFYDHFDPEAFPVPWWEIARRNGLFHLALCSGAALILAVYAARGRARLGFLLSTTAVVGAVVGALAVAAWVPFALVTSPMIQLLHPVFVFLAAAGIAFSVCMLIRRREQQARTPGWSAPPQTANSKTPKDGADKAGPGQETK